MPDIIRLDAIDIEGQVFNSGIPMWQQALRHLFDTNYDGFVDEGEARRGIEKAEDDIYGSQSKNKPWEPNLKRQDDLYKRDNWLVAHEISLTLNLAGSLAKDEKLKAFYKNAFENYSQNGGNAEPRWPAPVRDEGSAPIPSFPLRYRV